MVTIVSITLTQNPTLFSRCAILHICDDCGGSYLFVKGKISFLIAFPYPVYSYYIFYNLVMLSKVGMVC